MPNRRSKGPNPGHQAHSCKAAHKFQSPFQGEVADRSGLPLSLHKLLLISASLILLIATFSCNSPEKTPDTSNIKVNLQTSRFDLDLYAIDTNHVAEGLQKLAEKYPTFLNYYLDTLREYGIHGHFSDTANGIRTGVRVELTFKDFVNLEDSIKKHYPDTKDIDAQLTSGFQMLKYYFPSYHVPQIIYLNMVLSKWPSFPVDTSLLCIGLDMFLDDHFPYNQYIGLPDYNAPHRRSSYIPVSVFSTVYKTYHPFETDDKTLLDLMLQRGKEFYFLHKILPTTPDSVIFGYPQLQLDWCNKNEALIYNFFIHGNLLYEKQMLRTMPYVTEGPFAKGLEAPDDSVKYTPGSVGSWLGYRIVCAWMSQNPKTTLSDLVNKKTEAATFLDQAQYRPK